MLSPIRIPVWEEYLRGKGAVAYVDDCIAISELLGGLSFMMNTNKQCFIIDNNGAKHYPGQIVWVAGQVPEHLR